MDSAYFSGRSGCGKKFVSEIFLKLYPLCGSVAAKPLVLELLCLEVGTSVASALTTEIVFEIMKCVADVDMPARVRMGSKREIFMFFILATPTMEMLRFFDDGHSFEQETR